MIYDIDALQKTSVVSAALRELVAANKKLGDGEQRFDFAGDVSVYVTHNADRKVNKVVVVNHQTSKEQVIVEEIPDQVFGVISPNGQNLALCLYSMQPMTGSAILVISQKGELVSRIDVGKRQDFGRPR